jgi:hypothetical protein
MSVGGAIAMVVPLHAAYSADWNLPVNGKGWTWLAVGLWVFLAGLCVVLGISFVKDSLRDISYTVELRINGFRRKVKGEQGEARWADVQVIWQVRQYVRIRGLDMPFDGYRVVARSGTEYSFEAGTFPGFQEFGKILREIAHQQGISWEKVEVRS